MFLDLPFSVEPGSHPPFQSAWIRIYFHMSMVCQRVDICIFTRAYCKIVKPIGYHDLTTTVNSSLCWFFLESYP